MKRFTLCTAAFLWMLAGCSVKPSPSIQQPEKEISGVYQGTAYGYSGTDCQDTIYRGRGSQRSNDDEQWN